MVPRDKEAKKAEASVYERIRQMIRGRDRGSLEHAPLSRKGENKRHVKSRRAVRSFVCEVSCTGSLISHGSRTSRSVRLAAQREPGHPLSASGDTGDPTPQPSNPGDHGRFKSSLFRGGLAVGQATHCSRLGTQQSKDVTALSLRPAGLAQPREWEPASASEQTGSLHLQGLGIVWT
ncbi:unnamed protein product [Rangifer tarandus platyrhynchus]|uniref:Uncharacterized protein n=1 Tax=Rangifer tarandus platyrhynchus TaxID=3082113 RepID=A0AC59YDY1_RANTA